MLETLTDELLQLTASERGRRSGLYAYWELLSCTTRSSAAGALFDWKPFFKVELDGRESDSKRLTS